MGATRGAQELVGALMTEAGRADPYPIYAQLHGIGPASLVSEYLVVANGYAEVNAVLRSPAFGKWGGPGEPESPFAQHASLATLSRSVLDLNPPDHTRVRRLMSAVFTPRRTSGLAPAITATTDALLDAMAAAGADGRPVDFMDEFAFRLPVSVICELLGVPEADRYRFRDVARELGVALEIIEDLDVLAPADAATLEMREYFQALIAQRRADPQDDLISALAHEADDAAGLLSEEELISNLVVLLFAGFETTTNLFGNGLALLFERPELADALRAGSLAPSDFIEETLRYDSPVQLTSRRAMGDGAQVGGVAVPRDAEVLLLLGAANRDAARFPGPGVFDPARPDNQPLSFGAGGHFCLGAALARLEAAVAFPRLLQRFPRLAPADDAQRVRADRLVLRGYRTLPVLVD